jgi:ribosomal protein S18 acetylase RimI-like enzyme
MQKFSWCYQQSEIDWDQLSDLYRIAPLGNKAADDLQVVFSNSKFKCFVFEQTKLVGAGRALADGIDCAYICDVAIHPDHQGVGLGRKIIETLIAKSAGHKKILLYAMPGKQAFYQKLGFKKMNTAMAIFNNEKNAIDVGLLG